MNVANLPLSHQDPIAQFVRIGYDRRQMDELLAAGRFPVDRAVFRATLVPPQGDLLAALRAAGRETVLDTGVIDLVHPWRYKPKAHYLRQRRLPLENLANIPNLRRAEHFLNVDLTQIERKAGEIGRLKIADEQLKSKVGAQVKHIDKFYSVFTDLQESGISIGRSRAPLPRVSAPTGIQRRRR